MRQLEKKIEHLRQEIEKRTVQAPIGGRLHSGKRLRSLLGSHVERGERLGRVIGTARRHIVMVVPQSDAAIVRRGMDAEVRLWGVGTPTLAGRVQWVGRRFLDQVPHQALSSRFKGEVDTKATGDYKSQPSKPSVKVRLSLDDGMAQSAGVIDGMTGRGKVVVGTSTLGHQQWRTIRQAMSLDWWL